MKQSIFSEKRWTVFALSGFILLFVTNCGLGNLDAQDLGGGEWVAFAPVPVATQEIGVAELDGLIYVLGGILGTRAIGDNVQVYNPETNTWRSAAPMPTALHHMGVATVNGNLYVVGGYFGNFQPVDTLFEYNPRVNRWTERASLPTAKGGLIAVAIDGLIYATGGARGQSVDDLDVYDPQTDQWTGLRSMNGRRDHHAAAVIDDKIYVAGGRDQSNFTLDTMEVYDPETNRWTELTNMPTGRSGNAAAALNGCLYVFGGEGNRQNQDGVFPEVERYDPGSDSWTSITPMEVARHGIGAAVIDNHIFIPAGGPVQGLGVTNLNDALEVPEDISCEIESL